MWGVERGSGETANEGHVATKRKRGRKKRECDEGKKGVKACVFCQKERTRLWLGCYRWATRRRGKERIGVFGSTNMPPHTAANYIVYRMMNHLLPVYTWDRYTRALNDRPTVAGSWISRNSPHRIQLRALDDSPAGDRRVAVNFVCCTPSNYFLRTTLTNCPPFVGQRSQLIALASSVLIYKCISVSKRIK